MTVVTLHGGRFDRHTIDVDPLRRELTLQYLEHWSLAREYGELAVVPAQVRLESYRRVSADRFDVCPTQAGIRGYDQGGD